MYRSWPRLLANTDFNAYESPVASAIFYYGADLAPYIAQPQRQFAPEEMAEYSVPFSVRRLHPGADQVGAELSQNEIHEHDTWDYGMFQFHLLVTYS